jgi:hypothetical protein
MSQRDYSWSKSCIPLRRAIYSSVGIQTLPAGLLLCATLLCATYAGQAETVLPSGNDSKVHAGTEASRQLAVLYDDDPTDPNWKRYNGPNLKGYVAWRTEKVRQAEHHPGEQHRRQDSDIGIRADIYIPERDLKVVISFRRNRDLYPSGEIRFAVPPNFGGGSVGAVVNITVKPSERAAGTTLLGSAKSVVEGFIAFDLSDRAYNALRLIDQRSWLEISMLNDRRWARLTIETGASGRKVFEKAFTAWDVPPVDRKPSNRPDVPRAVPGECPRGTSNGAACLSNST